MKTYINGHLTSALGFLTMVTHISIASNIFSYIALEQTELHFICGAAIGHRNEDLFEWSRLHPKDDSHVHI